MNTADTEKVFDISHAPGGLLVIYLGKDTASDYTFEIRMEVENSDPRQFSAPVPQNVAKIVYTQTSIGDDLLITPNCAATWPAYNKFSFYRILVTQYGHYQVTVNYTNSPKWGFNFNSVEPKVHFAAPGPITVTTNRMNYVLFPLTNSNVSPVRVVVTGSVDATLYQPGRTPHKPYPIRAIKMSTGNEFEIGSVTNAPASFRMWGLREADDILTGRFKIMSEGNLKKLINIIAPTTSFPNHQMVTMATNAYRSVAGSFTNHHLVCSDMRIVSPTGTPPPEGEYGAEGYSPSIYPLLVFDMPGDEEGKCLMACETPRLAGLSSDFVRGLVWTNVSWIPPSVSTVTNVTFDTPPGEPWKTKFCYNQMPSHNDAFGNKNLVLRFGSWKWNQPVQFRFARTGTSAAAAALAGGTISSNYVAAGNPNWYVYWQQVANGFSGDGSGTFGPQATKMYYNNAIVGDRGQAGDHMPTAWYPTWKDEIRMFDTNSANIVACIKTIHHENGHHQSHELPPSQGGFGSEIARTWESDRDGDLINDLWETNAAPGYLLGFEINETTVSINQVWRGNWDHGWTNATGYGSCTNPPPYPDPGPYCNPGGYNPATGSGLCVRNGSHVFERAEPIRLKDWSFKGP